MKLLTLFHTLRHLKIQQIFHLFRKRIVGGLKIEEPADFSFSFPEISTEFPKKMKTLEIEVENKFFRFIGKRLEFRGWDMDEEPLWIFNLHYFEYLNQREIDSDQGFELILSWIDFIESNPKKKELYLHSYPASLRVVNWLKFLHFHKVRNEKIEKSIATQLLIIFNNLESDIQANHLFTNLSALMFALPFFSSPQFERIRKRTEKLFLLEMKEEVFEDGCHYERSFLYHSIILEMLLDIKNIGFEVPDLDVNLKKMEKVLFSFVVDGKIPLFNDAAYDIALDPEKLFQYCEKLGIKQSFGKDILFPAGNFAVLKCGELILHVDGGGMVSYQPGHMHASALSFEIYKDGKKMITDRGCLTYLPGKDRSFLRSTAAHNTISIDGKDQHEMWGAFRVGRRGRNYPLAVEGNTIFGKVRGWRGEVHERKFTLLEKGLRIEDQITFCGNHCAGLMFPVLDDSISISSSIPMEKNEGRFFQLFNSSTPCVEYSGRCDFKDRVSITTEITFDK